MTVEDARKLIHNEYHNKKGLLILFRMSFDVEEERIKEFLKALSYLEEYYTDKKVIEKELVYQLLSLSDTLKASMGHWKVSRPKGLDKDTCWKIIEGIRNIFSS